MSGISVRAMLCGLGGCRSSETVTYSVWVYFGGEQPAVYSEEMPNTEEVRFEFSAFSRFHWECMELSCIRSDVHVGSYYSSLEVKKFMIRHMLVGCSLPWIDLGRRNGDGSLADSEYDKVMSLHPRIMRTMFDGMDIFDRMMTPSEEKAIEKQCRRLFEEDRVVSDPHPLVSSYCNLVSFWDKLGLNYFDIMRLPNDLFLGLKKVMSLENSYRIKSMERK